MRASSRDRLATLALAGCAVAAVSACTPPAVKRALPPLQAAQAKPVGTIHDLMTLQIDPSADDLWAAVSETITAAGVERHEPRTDADWLALRARALILAELPSLLAAPGRLAARPGGGELADAGAPGILTTAQIQAHIDADRPALMQRAEQLQAAAVSALAAIDTRDPAALSRAGGDIDEACEACHLKFWYPPPIADSRG